MQRVPISVLEFDKRFINPFAENETNGEKMRYAKNALKRVIKEDLSPKQSKYLLLYYVEKRSCKEIAEMMGLDPSTISKTIQRARNNIGDRLKYYFS